ncbi:hypothetical protein [Halegenticoccus soli]|uniref:hypothetical protein n=1 Tax=Halegenticoccus soli TaxID=1985678 RepID=UPI000C6E99A0|nr:hypothetical protein [Halegenticoccus soli]
MDSNADGEGDGRTAVERAASWFLLEGSRVAIAGGALFALLLAFSLVVGLSDTGRLRPTSSVFFLFSSLLTGDLTLITVVLSINQLVLSRELGEPGDLRGRVQETLDYRREVRDSAERSVPPTTPSRFLQFLHEEVGSLSESLRETVGAADDEELRGRVDSLAESIAADVRAVNRTLERDESSAFNAVSATLRTNHADQLREIELIEDEFGASLPSDAVGTLDRVTEALLQIDVAREYFKTVYVQKELAFLSRLLLYVGVPAVGSSVVVLALYSTANVGSLSTAAFDATVAVALTIGLAPLAVLFSFVLRLAWIAQRTATVAPFTASGREYRP